MDRNHYIFGGKIDTRMRNSAKSPYVLLFILHHGFGKWCFWVATSNVVLKMDIQLKWNPPNEIYRFLFLIWRLPFDTRSPIVYLIVVTYQFIVAVYTFLFMACVLSIGIGDYLFLLSATVDIKRNLRSINKCARAQKNQLNMVFKELTDVIQLHSKSKEYESFLFFWYFLIKLKNILI